MNCELCGWIGYDESTHTCGEFLKRDLDKCKLQLKKAKKKLADIHELLIASQSFPRIGEKDIDTIRRMVEMLGECAREEHRRIREERKRNT